MRDVLAPALEAWQRGEAVAVATVIATWRSAPRPAGASMLVTGDGRVVGSISGGCVESDVYEVCREVLTTGTPQLRRYGVSDDDAFAVGLTCGGILDVFVERISPASFGGLDAVARCEREHAPLAIATVVEHPDAAWVGRRLVVGGEGAPASPGSTASPTSSFSSRSRIEQGSLGSARADAAVRDDALGLLALGESRTLTYGPDGQRRGEGMRVFVDAWFPPPRMIVFGAIDFAAALARAGAFLGYRVTVCDARPLFATSSRFPGVEVVVEQPHRYLAAEAGAGRLDARTVVAVLTHEPRFDVPVLEVALRLPLAYVGAMGSRRTHDDRLRRLREVGLSDAELARLASPLGLDIGARTPAETAVSITAEIIARRWGGSGSALSDLNGPIHGHGEGDDVS